MFWRRFLPVAAAVGLASAQVKSDCDPTKGEDCLPNPALSTNQTWHFNSTPNGQLWETQVGPIHFDDTDGAARFTIEEQGDSPTIRSKFYIFFGRVSFTLKASTGKGIVSSMMLLSDNLDEIDWEFIGTNSSATTNFYGKGIEDYTNGDWHEAPNPVHDEFHNYTIVWEEDKLEWWIDDGLVRTVLAEEAKSENGTDIYPQTPSRVSLGIWAGGDPRLEEGTREWAGGDTDYDAGPYDMLVKSVYVEDFSSGKEYVWTDETGDKDSIEIVDGESEAIKTINQKPEKSLNEKFNDIPQGGKIAIFAGAAAVGAIIIAGVIFYCIRQRRRGASEARVALQASEADRFVTHRQSAAFGSPNFADQDTEYRPPGAMQSATGLGGKSYGALNASSSTIDNEKPGDDAVDAGAALRIDTQSPRVPSPAGSNPFGDDRGSGSPSSLSHPGFEAPPHVAPARTPSPGLMTRSPASPGPQQAYGAHRMQQQSISGGASRPFNGGQEF